MRLETQAESQLNCMGTIVDGIYKRPNSQHLKTIVEALIQPGCKTHTINRDIDERFTVIMTGDSTTPILVYDEYGIPQTVVTDSATREYLELTGSSPKVSFKLITLGDDTYILNNTKTVLKKPDVTEGTLSGIKQYLTDLTTDLKEDEPAPTNCQIFQISGGTETGFDDYFVKYNINNSKSINYFEETVEPGITYQLDETTLPHVLKWTGSQFELQTVTWGERDIGNEDSNPTPSFVDNCINNILFFRDRLGFLSKDKVIFSRTGDYHNFWHQTALERLDDDPIDVACSSRQVANLRSTSTFAKNLLIFSDQQQLILSSGDKPLTPATVRVDATTFFEIEPNSEPVSAGSCVYFNCPKGEHSLIREYVLEPDTLVEDANDVTGHVPSYVPSGQAKMVVCTAMDMVLGHFESDLSTLYVYKYFWQETEKPQSAWSKWTFDGDILGIDIVMSTLYVVIRRGSQICFEKMQLENVTFEGLPFRPSGQTHG